MTEKNQQQRSELIDVLRETISVVQMVIFKELRRVFAQKYAEKDTISRAMLVGAIINKLFGMENPEKKFQEFNRQNGAVIEQELLGFAGEFPQLLPYLTDALRVQVLCDQQEGEDSTRILEQAEELRILLKDREVPLPSTFMTQVRDLGEKHGLTVAPQEISPENNSLIH